MLSIESNIKKFTNKTSCVLSIPDPLAAEECRLLKLGVVARDDFSYLLSV